MLTSTRSTSRARWMRGHHDANPRIRIDIADGLRLHSTDVVFDSVVDRHREYIAYEIAHGVDVVVDRLCE